MQQLSGRYMANIEHIESEIAQLPIFDRIELVKRLRQVILTDLEVASEISEQKEIDVMEQRLAKYEAGEIASKTWMQVEADIRSELNL